MSKSPSFLSPPSYVKHKASGQAVVYQNGQTTYLGKYGSAASKEAYRRLVAEWSLTGGRPESHQEISVAEVMAAYVAFAKGYYRKRGEVTREHGMIVEVCRAIKPLYGRVLVIEFGPLALKMVRQSLIDSGYARKHINKQIDRVKRMFRWAAGEEMIPATIPQALGMVTGLRKGRTEAHETAPVQPVDDATVEATLEHLPAVVGDMVRLQRLTGCRPAEVCILRPCDIDRTGDVWLYRPESHKTEHHGRERTIFIGPQSQAVLLRYLARASDAYCFRPCDSEAKRLAQQEANRVTPASCGNCRGSNVKKKPKRKPGDCYTTGSYRRAIHRACDKAKVERWSPNRLRHTAATEIRREFGLEAAQVILGHSQANVTQVYAERDIAKGLAVAAKIG